jgi:hypothetical protein
MAANLRALSEALRGKPSETEAVKVIAVFATIPAATAGIFGGVAFVPPAADSGVLLLSAAGGAVAAAAVTLLLIHAAYRVFGFRSVSGVGSAVMGAFLGFSLLSVFLSVSSPALLGTIAGAVAGGAVGWLCRPSASRVHEAEEQGPAGKGPSPVV